MVEEAAEAVATPRFTLLQSFYKEPPLPLISASTRKLELITIGVYVLGAVAFAILVFIGLTTEEEVSVTLIVPTLSALVGEGYVCKNLGSYTGVPYTCLWHGNNPKFLNALCNPLRSPMEMENVFFESYEDCMGKMESILAALLYNREIGNATRFMDGTTSFEVPAHPRHRERPSQIFGTTNTVDFVYSDGSMIEIMDIDGTILMPPPTLGDQNEDLFGSFVAIIDPPLSEEDLQDEAKSTKLHIRDLETPQAMVTSPRAA
ncbi:hypothetical protein ATCC90586_006609 [Pythium insidiosum]|nr:hypothetical protein ATCC90586_006609 [Pythium insidiosum]